MAAYYNVTGAGQDDGPGFFRLYTGQTTRYRTQARQHADKSYIDQHPSLQCSVCAIRDRPLYTVCYGTFPKPRPGDTEDWTILLNLLEILGALLLQTLGWEILEPFLPELVKIPCLNVHLNVLSPLLQQREGNIAQEHVDGSLALLKESDDPFIQQYILDESTGNPIIMAIVERRLEMKGGQPLAYDDLPEILKST